MTEGGFDLSSERGDRSPPTDYKRSLSRSRSHSRDAESCRKNDGGAFLLLVIVGCCILAAIIISICAIFLSLTSVDYSKYLDHLRAGLRSRSRDELVISNHSIADVYSKNYDLQIKFVDYNKFEGEVILTLEVKMKTKEIFLRAGKDLRVSKAFLMDRRDVDLGHNGNVTRDENGGIIIYFDDILLEPVKSYFLLVQYESDTTTEPGGGLYHAKFGEGDDLLLAVRNLTQIDHIVPISDINTESAIWSLTVIAPPNFVIFFTSRVKQPEIEYSEHRFMFEETPPIVAADLVLLIGSNESIWTDDVSLDKTPLLNRNESKNITLYNVGLRTGEMAIGSEVQTTINEYLKKYRFYDLDQIVLLTTEGVKFSDNSALSGNHYVGGSLIVTPSSQHGIHSRLFARMLFGNHLYSKQSYEQALLAALADYTALLTFNDADGLQVIAKELQELAMNEEKPHSSKWHSHWAHTYAFPGESKTDKGFKLIVGLHALAQLTEREKFIENLQDLVYSPPNTHFTALEFSNLLKIDGLTCENDPDHALFNIHDYLQEIYENDQYPVVRVTSMPGDSSRVEISQEPNFGQIPLIIRSSSGSAEPFVLCSAIIEVNISVGETFESLHGFYTLSIESPSD